MKFSVQAGNPLEFDTPALIIGCGTDPAGTPLFDAISAALGGVPGRMYESKEFTGKPGSVKVIHTLGALPAQRIVLVGVGDPGEVTPEKIRRGGRGRGPGAGGRPGMFRRVGPPPDCSGGGASGGFSGGGIAGKLPL